MQRILEKKERALGAKLFLKGDRCNSAKCATVKKPYAPGPHGKKRKRMSEYGKQLQEKQKVRFSYGLTEKDLAKIFSSADKSKEPTDIALIRLLESRLDNVVFRLGFAASRRIGKQLVGHGHIHVNGRKVTIPSYLVRKGDKISFRPESKDHPIFKELENRLKNHQAPSWLNLDKEKIEGVVASEPKDDEMLFDLNLVVNYYSK